MILDQKRSFYLVPLLRNKLLPVCRNFSILRLNGLNSGHFGSKTKFLSVTVGEKQTTSGLSEFFDFTFKRT